MPLIPPTGKPKPKPKGRPKRQGRNAAENLDLKNLIEDTPTPPTEPIPEPEPTSAPRATPKARAGSLEARLKEAFAGLSVLPTMAGDQYSGFIIASRSEKFAHDLAELARVNPRVKKILENMMDGGTYGGVIFSGAAMLLPILWSYGIVPAPPVDPFSMFYPSVPAGVTPRTARTVGRSSRQGGSATPGGEGSPSPRTPGGAPDGPLGVVTVRPGAHPPVNAAATQ